MRVPTDWYFGLLGGGLIGLGSLIVMLASGKIPGISGMFSRVLVPQPGDASWRWTFFVGLLFGAWIAYTWIDRAAIYHPVNSIAVVVTAGVLVGFGTRVGGGCTSGYGVCGIGMGSRTAITATILFMLSAMITVWVMRQVGASSLP